MKPLCWESGRLFWQEALVEGGGESAGMPEEKKRSHRETGQLQKGEGGG